MSFNKSRLTSLRIKNKLTIYKVAWDTFIDASVLQRIESGKTKNPSFNTVATLADYFKVNMETFKTGTKI